MQLRGQSMIAMPVIAWLAAKRDLLRIGRATRPRLERQFLVAKPGQAVQ
jgi:hypothetical protein